MEPEVTDEEIAEFTRRKGIQVFKCSAKTGMNVESTFLKLTEILINNSQPNVYGSSGTEYVGPGQGGDTKTLFQQKKQGAGYCCGM